MRKIIGLVLLVVIFGCPLMAQDKTTINDKAAKANLLGKHRLSLQWISWDYFGVATITEKNGTLYLRGEQKSRKGDDYVKIDGIITAVDKKTFTFNGTVITKVNYNNEGKPCTREGELTFAIKGTRKYWRLQQMQSPCGVETDYVDIYFKK